MLNILTDREQADTADKHARLGGLTNPHTPKYEGRVSASPHRTRGRNTDGSVIKAASTERFASTIMLMGS